MSRNHQSIKNKFAKANEAKIIIAMSDYIQSRAEWVMWPGKMVDGKYYVQYMGKWVINSEFVKDHPKPNVMDFKLDPTNCDKTKTYLVL